MNWHQMYVKYPGGNTSAEVGKHERMLERFGSLPPNPTGDRILSQPDGSVKIRSYGPPDFAKKYLVDNGFEIVHEVEHKD